MTKWATGKPCQWCGILWAVVEVAYKVRALGATEARTQLCTGACLPRAKTKTVDAVEKPWDAFYEYVTEVST